MTDELDKRSCRCCGETTREFLVYRTGRSTAKSTSPPNPDLIRCANCSRAVDLLGMCPHEAIRLAELRVPIDPVTLAEIETSDPDKARVIRDSRRVDPPKWIGNA